MTGLAARLKQLRNEMGITQTELASRLGTERSAVSNWETGVRRPRSDTIASLCRFFDVSVDYLCGRVESRNKVIVPPTISMDVTKLNHDGQKMLESYYEFLLQNDKFIN